MEKLFLDEVGKFALHVKEFLHKVFTTLLIPYVRLMVVEYDVVETFCDVAHGNWHKLLGNDRTD
jgi:hypothetical protein